MDREFRLNRKFRLTIDIYPSLGSKKIRHMELKDVFDTPDKDGSIPDINGAITKAGCLIQAVNLEHDRLEGYDLKARLTMLYSNEMIDKLVWELRIVSGEGKQYKY